MGTRRVQRSPYRGLPTLNSATLNPKSPTLNHKHKILNPLSGLVLEIEDDLKSWKKTSMIRFRVERSKLRVYGNIIGLSRLSLGFRVKS